MGDSFRQRHPIFAFEIGLCFVGHRRLRVALRMMVAAKASAVPGRVGLQSLSAAI
jgi:hypothetical protein